VFHKNKKTCTLKNHSNNINFHCNKYFKIPKVENYQDYQLQQQQNYRLDKDMLMDKTKQKRKLIYTLFLKKKTCQGNKKTLSRI